MPPQLLESHSYDEVYSVQHNAIKFVNDLQQVGGFLRVLQFPPPMKVVLNTSILNSNFQESFVNYLNLNIPLEDQVL